MKSIYTLILVLIAGSTAYGQSNLPPCQGTDVRRWSNCFGSANFPNGHKYVGEWRDGKQNGQGTFTFASGEKYVGEIKEAKRNGQGANTYANGDKYIGEWSNDKENGQGTFTFSDGGRYVGEHKDGKKHGQGTFFLPDGKFALSEWIEDKPSGRFIEYRADKTVGRSGIYKDGQLVTSQYIDPNFFSRIASSNIPSEVSDNLQKNSQNIDSAKSKCEELGFKLTTEEFGKCVLQLTK
jgi:hypothetical protein